MGDSSLHALRRSERADESGIQVRSSYRNRIVIGEAVWLQSRYKISPETCNERKDARRGFLGAAAGGTLMAQAGQSASQPVKRREEWVVR
jgi:hypothetical protein